MLPDSFFPSFFPLLSFVPLPLTRTAFRNAPGSVFYGKESHSSPELSDALKTNKKQLEKGIILKIYLFAIGVVLLGLSDMFGGMWKALWRGDGRLYCVNFSKV